MTTDVEKRKQSPEYKATKRAVNSLLNDLQPAARRKALKVAAGSIGGSKKATRRRDSMAKGDYSDTKLPQADAAVNYKDNAGSTEKFCGNCLFFQGDRTYSWGSCSLVAGGINQTGISDLWREIKPVPTHEQVQAVVDGMNPDDFIKTRLWIDIIEKNEEKQLVTGVVLVPEVFDSQGDIVSDDEIGKAVVKFSERLKNKIQHKSETEDVRVVESYQAPAEFVLNDRTVTKGSWVMTVLVKDDALWKRVKAGDFTGFSIGGRGNRTPVEAAA